ncbi:hypothetical protein BU17DRAFT_55341 [Hysterangium stoloniferum]|nr:hypothetical protein BU17DRAFT_55341 [Hysterangium stoloniferum]
MLAGKAYILQNQVTHVRYLPSLSKHSFMYPTFSLLVSLNSLENNELQLFGGLLFGYGSIWNRVTGLGARGYLYNIPKVPRTIRHKLIDVLNSHGHNGEELDDSWLMTMPSFLGIEGINPLSVHFCYRRGSTALWITVLEVHNTFGERHVYVLDAANSKEVTHDSFHYQWTFPRQFHVSPFNDRSGHYLCQMIPPSRPPSDTPLPHPRPIIKLTLLTAPPQSSKKLVAVQRSVSCTPLSNWNLLSTLICSPLGLLLALPRIIYQAYLLHYHKRLDVYARPEPCAPDSSIEGNLPTVINKVQTDAHYPPRGAVGWASKGLLEKWCEKRVYQYLRRRITIMDISVTFIPANIAERRVTISPETSQGSRVLIIHYRSPRIFPIIFMTPSAAHALLLGVHADKVFSVSSEDLFKEAFSASSEAVVQKQPWLARKARNIREASVPSHLGLTIPSCHPLDDPPRVVAILVLSLLFLLERIEKGVFGVFRARFVEGNEPWGGWERLVEKRTLAVLGSVRRGP